MCSPFVRLFLRICISWNRVTSRRAETSSKFRQPTVITQTSQPTRLGRQFATLHHRHHYRLRPSLLRDAQKLLRKRVLNRLLYLWISLEIRKQQRPYLRIQNHLQSSTTASTIPRNSQPEAATVKTPKWVKTSDRVVQNTFSACSTSFSSWV